MRKYSAFFWSAAIVAAFGAGYGWGLITGYGKGLNERYEAVEHIVLFEHNSQFKKAIADGMPFKLKGTDINIFPRDESSVSATASGRTSTPTAAQVSGLKVVDAGRTMP